MNPIEFLMWVVAPWGFALFVFGIYRWFQNKWNIPMVILRFTGDKRRPNLIVTKAKKLVFNNNVELKVKGYNRRFRDFIAENYYPSPASKFGGLIAFEFEDGWLTPLRTAWKRLTKKQREEASALVCKLENMTNTVDFEYDKATHDQLKLTIVDDVDSETYLIEQSRINTQYRGAAGWFKENAWWLLLMVVVVLLFIGFVMWLKENPQNAAQQCVAQLGQVCGSAWNYTSSHAPPQGWVDNAVNSIQIPGG